MTIKTSSPLKPIDFYHNHYVYLPTPSHLSPDMPRIVLGDQDNRTCRFCHRKEPDTSFRNDAHAIPELLGNKTLFSTYECDECNQYFGDSIENDLGNWSIVNRTMSGIRGKRKVPTLKGTSVEPTWQITRNASGLHFKEYIKSSVYEIDEKNNAVTFHLTRGSYTPIAVFKSFTKIGLTLLSHEEIGNFGEALDWVRDPDHANGFVEKCSITFTFVPGQMPCDVIIVRLLKRKPQSIDLPYIFLILGYGNYLIQTWLPCRKKDAHIWGGTLEMPPFPPIIAPKSTICGSPSTRVLDLSGREQVGGQSSPHTFKGESIEIRD